MADETEHQTTIVDKALARYDTAVSVVSSRFAGVGLISHHELNALAGAIRQGLADALNYLEDPDGVDATEAAAKQDARDRAEAVTLPTLPTETEAEPETEPETEPDVSGEAQAAKDLVIEDPDKVAAA